MSIKNRRGSTLILTLITFVVLIIFATVLVRFMVTENKISLQHQRKIQAYYIARAGAEAVEAAIMDMDEIEVGRLIVELDNNKIRIQEMEIDEGKVEVMLIKSVVGLAIESKGEVDKENEVVFKDIYIKQEETETVNIDMAIFADSNMVFEDNTQNNVVGNIGTNSLNDNTLKFISGFNDKITINIPIGSDITKVISKPSWDTKIPKINYIDKRVYSLATFPEYPIDLPNNGSIITNWDNSNPIINASAYYDSLTIKSNYSTTIDTTKGDIVLRIKDFDVQQGSIKVEGNGKIKLYIDNYKNFKGGFNIGGDSRNVEIFYNGEATINIANETKIFGSFFIKQANVNITGSGAITGNLISGGNMITMSGGSYVHSGVIYAPNTDIKILGSGNVKGGLVGKNIYLKGGASIKYDSAYANNIPIVSSNSTIITFKPGYFK